MSSQHTPVGGLLAGAATLALLLVILIVISLLITSESPTCPTCGGTGLSAAAQAGYDETVWMSRK